MVPLLLHCASRLRLSMEKWDVMADVGITIIYRGDQID